MHFVYILKSKKWDRYYVGETHDISKRLKKHNTKGVKSTKNGCPWILIWSTDIENRVEGRKLERTIKKRDTKRYLEDINFL